jgi:hypothetical protein
MYCGVFILKQQHVVLLDGFNSMYTRKIPISSITLSNNAQMKGYKHAMKKRLKHVTERRVALSDPSVVQNDAASMSCAIFRPCATLVQ